MIRHRTYLDMLLLTFTAFLFVFSFPNGIFPSGCSVLAFVFALPLFYVFARSSLTWNERVLYAFIWSVIAYLLLVIWLAKISLAGYLMFVCLLACQPLVFTAFVRPPDKIHDVFFIPALWVTTEMMRVFFLDGFTWTLGHSQAFSGWGLAWTAWGGSYAVSFGIVLINALLFGAVRKRKACFKFLVCVLFLLLSGWASFWKPGANEWQETIQICAVQPEISFSEKNFSDNVEGTVQKLIRASNGCFDGKQPDMIAWPETAITDDVLDEPWISAAMTRFIKQSRTPLLTGSALLIKGENYNSAVLLDGASGPQIYHKQKLVPFVEMCPVTTGLGWLRERLCDYTFSAGQGPAVFYLPKNGQRYPFGVVICSEDNYPNLFRALKQKGALFTVVLLNDARLGAVSAHHMHLQNSIMQAYAFGMPVLRVTNSGVTAYIDPRGRWGSSENAARQGSSWVFKVKGQADTTFYACYGDIFGWACVIFVIIDLLHRYIFNRGQ